MNVEITRLENQFITHIRTLQLRFLSMHKDKKVEYVFIPMSEIKEHYFEDPNDSIEKLKDLKLIETKKFTTKNGHRITLFKSLKDGGIDFSLIKRDSQTLDEITSVLKSNLRWVGLAPNIGSTKYFVSFLQSLDYSLDPFFLVDKFSGRVHTPITSLKSDVRNFLLIKNEKTISLDIAQMQPLLLAHILKENVEENEFTNWIEQGEDIYIMFQNKLNLQTREEAKTKFYEIIFGKSNNQLANLFSNSNWIKWVNELKSTSFNPNPHSLDKNYSNLAWLLQSTEVAIMTKIWRQLIKNDIIFLTVHDEIIVRESDYEETYKIMHDTMSYHFSTFKINTKSRPCVEEIEITLKEKFAKVPTDVHFYPNEFYDKFKIDKNDIQEAVSLNIIEKSFEGSYQLKTSI